MKKEDIYIEQVSPFDVETTVDKLIAAAIEKEWQNTSINVPKQPDVKSDENIRPIKVIEICKPEYSGYLHEKNQEKVVTVVTMPCRISVYEKNDGKAYVSLLNMAAMVTGLQSTADEVIRDASMETIEIVKSVIGIF